MSAAIILKHTATTLQVVTLVGFAVLVMSREFPPVEAKVGFQLFLFALLPIIIQAVACRMLRDPAIYVASMVASLLVLVFLCGDIFSPFYFPASLLFSLPTVLVMMFLGWVVFFWRRWLRTTKFAAHASSTHDSGTTNV